MEYMTVRNWAKFQHYKDRNPPWIKLHFELLSSRDWVMLDDAGKLLAVACMLIASRNEGKVPCDPDYISRVAYIKRVNFKPLIECGFLDVDSSCKQVLADACPETETETDRNRERSVIDFDEFWQIYPRHVAKQDALSAYTKARKGGTAHEAIIRGARRYADECRGKEQRFVAHAKSWLNAGRWEDAPGANRDSVGGAKPNGNPGKNRPEPQSRAGIIAELISELPEAQRSKQGIRFFEDEGNPGDSDGRPIIIEGALSGS
jgi:hypothetical protein